MIAWSTVGPRCVIQHLQGAKHTQSHEESCPHAEMDEELEPLVSRSKRDKKSLELSFPFFLQTELKEIRSLFCSQTELQGLEFVSARGGEKLRCSDHRRSSPWFLPLLPVQQTETG